jgi:hypothetical protein
MNFENQDRGDRTKPSEKAEATSLELLNLVNGDGPDIEKLARQPGDRNYAEEELSGTVMNEEGKGELCKWSRQLP